MPEKPNPKNIWKHIEITSSCWIWKGSTTSNGYGHLNYAGKNYLSHRFVYELLEDKIPNNLVIDHLCRNRKCVNPAHLDIVTFKENLSRGEGQTKNFGERNAAFLNKQKTQCPQGHLYENNLIISKTGRKCRKCHNERQKIYHQKVKCYA